MNTFLVGHMCGNADILAIRFREQVKKANGRLQLWAEEDGCIVCAKPNTPPARRVVMHEPERVIGTYTTQAKASEIADDIGVSRAEMATRAVKEWAA